LKVKNDGGAQQSVSQKINVGVISLGCSKNLVNSEQMMYLLSSAGYHVSGETDGADIVLINTCGFIESAKSEAIEVILEIAALKNEGRVGKLVVAGCLPERYKDNILIELPEIDAVVGTGSFDNIVAVADSLVKTNPNKTGLEEKPSNVNAKAPMYFGDIHAPVSETGRIITTSPVWAYLKIAEGCDNRCAYCCIPEIRGRYRSRPMENIIAEATQLTEKGIQELIVVAQDTTRYGLDLYGKLSLTDLLRELGGIKKLRWIRLLYLYPDEVDETLIDEIAKNGKILKYLDIPIQHINDGILENMRRRTTGTEIRTLFRSLREGIPGVVLRTSLITGLPGEGIDEFTELCEFLREAKIERAGVFAYSPEDGTQAALMERPDSDVALYRAEQIQNLQMQIMNDFNKSRVGTKTQVLIEEAEGPFVWRARSYAEAPDVDGYIQIRSRSRRSEAQKQLDSIEANSFLYVRIIGIEGDDLVGEPL